METLFSMQGFISLLTLTFLEIVLGIDNIIFISLTSARLPSMLQARGRSLGIAFALGVRILLLLAINWITGLTTPLLTIEDFNLSIRDLILMAGGLFLVAKSTSEIHARLEGQDDAPGQVAPLTLRAAVIQIVLLDVVFSFDSILTAIGLVDEVWMMITAIVIALGVMLLFSRRISDFIQRHPAMKLLAISFLMMIGLVLVLEGFHVHVPKGYLYFAMAFSMGVELLNMRIRKTQEPVRLHRRVPDQKVTGNRYKQGRRPGPESPSSP